MIKNRRIMMIIEVVVFVVFCVAGFVSEAEDTAEVVAEEMPETGVLQEIEVQEEEAKAQEETTTEPAVPDMESLGIVSDSAVQMLRGAVEEAQEEAKAQEEAQAMEEEQKELLASIIFCEAGNQPYEGQVAVGAVVMNRVQSEAFPDTIEEVIYQSGQFSPASSGWLDQVRSAEGYTDSSWQAAEDALAGVNPVGECLYFDRGGSGMQIGEHYFH